MGTVAQGVWKHLEGNRDLMKARMGADFELSKAVVRDISKRRDISIPAEKLTQNPLEVVNDPDIDIVCELMGGTDAARDLTLAALNNGKVVVSANKALISACGSEIFEAARRAKGAYFFEASVGGGIPVIKVIREGLVANSFSRIYGILNGTCNYILTRMERENAPYEVILKDAKRLGYVEADESLDIDGWDSAHKISILAYLAHGAWIDPHSQMIVEGIRNVRLDDMVWAREAGYRIKLVASCVKNPQTGALSAGVCPALLPLSDVVANVNEVYNAVSLEGDVVGRTVHIGRGAGRDATASAVIADIADAVKYLSGAPMSFEAAREENTHIASLSEIQGAFYLRIEGKDEVGVLACIANVLAQCGVSVELLQQKKPEERGRAWLLLTTHKTSEEAIKKACRELEGQASVLGAPFMLRIY